MPFDTLVLAALGGSLASLVLSVAVLIAIIRLRGDVRSAELLLALRALEGGQERADRTIADAMGLARRESAESARSLREEVAAAVRQLSHAVLTQTAETARAHKEQALREHETLVKSVGEVRDQTLQHLAAMKSEAATGAKTLSETITSTLTSFGDANRQHSSQLFDIQKHQHASFEQRIAAFGEVHGKAAEALRLSLESQLTTLRQDNTQKLEAMRVTVDEKLQGTLERRLGESFKLVSDRLEAVHQGLGEMQSLATGVGDLKRVLTNVKARGTWGEVQLGALLEQILTTDQYRKNVAVQPTSSERVEFAVLMPGHDEELLLPIDCKFPIEDYERLQAAAEMGDVAQVELASKALETRFRQAARDISQKYVHPPRTTDFAIMFLPTEGLYAEALRRPGLADELLHTLRVLVAGPSTLTAILSALQMGFKSLAVQQRSSEVWQVLGAVKAEFGKFGDVLGSVKKKLQEASNHIDKVEVRSRAISRSLREVEALPEGQGKSLLLEQAEDFDAPDAAEAVEGRGPALRVVHSDFFGDA